MLLFIDTDQNSKTGWNGYDYLLKIVVPGVAHFQELMERLLQDDIGIEKFTSRIVLRESSGKRTYPLALIAAAKSVLG